MQYILHDNPVGRAAQNYIIQADVSRLGPAPVREQLWTIQLTDNPFEIACRRSSLTASATAMSPRQTATAIGTLGWEIER